MRILTFDELSAESEKSVQLMDVSTGWMPLDFKKIRRWRSPGYPWAEYLGVYAVEGNEVLSAVRVLRVPYTMNDGTVETVTGIQGVVTRRESSGKGLARKLLTEVHRREEEAGVRLSILETGFNNIAHNLYTTMGYADVFSPRHAIKKLTAGKRERTPKVTKAKIGDAETMQKLHSEATKGRVGFTPRPKELVRAMFKLGFTSPGSYRLVHIDGKPAAYFHIGKGHGWVKSGEVVIKPGVDPGIVLSALESEARSGWLVIQSTFANDCADILRKRGYAFTDYPYWGLLAKPLGTGKRDVRNDMGVDGGSFTCQHLDYSRGYGTRVARGRLLVPA